jgi:hypothetical protein
MLRGMIRLHAVVALACCQVGQLHAAVLVPNANIQFSNSGDHPPANYTAVVNQNNAADLTQAWFQLSGNASSGYSFGLTTYLTDEGADWYWVSNGEVFSKQTISDHIWMDNLAFPFSTSPRPVATDFYLGVSTGNIDSGPDQRDVFGWVHFKIVLGALTMVENVLAYESVGIVIGTTQTVPEPSTFAIAAASLIAVSLVRRRNRPLPAPA